MICSLVTTRPMVWGLRELTVPPMASFREGYGCRIEQRTLFTLGFQVNNEYVFSVSITHATFGTYFYLEVFVVHLKSTSNWASSVLAGHMCRSGSPGLGGGHPGPRASGAWAE